MRATMATVSMNVAKCATHRANAGLLASRTNALTTFGTRPQQRALNNGIICQQGTTDEPSTSGRAQPNWNIKMLYDGDCPLCMREVDMLRRRDADINHICFVDVADPNYDPSEHADISFEQAMERIHAVLPDGTVVKDVEVFRRLYEEVGLGWIYAVTKIPAVEKAANAVYDVWAKYRLPITGRPDLAVVLQEKRSCKAPVAERS